MNKCDATTVAATTNAPKTNVALALAHNSYVVYIVIYV